MTILRKKFPNDDENTILLGNWHVSKTPAIAYIFILWRWQTHIRFFSVWNTFLFCATFSVMVLDLSKPVSPLVPFRSYFHAFLKLSHRSPILKFSIAFLFLPKFIKISRKSSETIIFVLILFLNSCASIIGRIDSGESESRVNSLVGRTAYRPS